MLCQKNELYFILPASGGSEEEGGRAEEETAISSSSAGGKKKPGPQEEQLSEEPLSLAGDCHLPGGPDGPGLMRKMMAWGLQGGLRAPHLSDGAEGGRWAKKTSLRSFGQREASEGVPPGCTGSLVWAVPPPASGHQHHPNFGGSSLGMSQPSHACAVRLPRERRTAAVSCLISFLLLFFSK